MLRRHSPIPLYRQVERHLLAMIESGTLRAGDRVPSEAVLAEEFGVNRLTVRQAIGELSRAGHVSAKQGLGTFVSVPPLVVEVELPPQRVSGAQLRGAQLYAAQGKVMREAIITCEIAGDERIAEALGAQGDLHKISTITSDEDGPYIVSSFWIDTERFSDVQEWLVDAVAVYDVLRDRFGVELSIAWRSYAAVAASSIESELLNIPVGSPLMHREGVNNDRAGRPTVFLIRRIRGDRIRFVHRYEDDSVDAPPSRPPTPSRRGSTA
jgi:GntR family transcriptional regulator